MDQSLYTHWIVPISILLMAVCLLAIGLRGLFARHPFVVSGRWVLLYVGAWATMPFWVLVRALFGGHMSQQWLSVFVLVIASGSVIAIIIYCCARGYWAYGVTTTSLHEGLRASLKAIGLRSEVGFGGVYLPNGTYISVSMQTFRGVGRIRLEPYARSLLRDVAAGMNRYYAASNAAMDRSACYLYTVGGLLMIGWVLYSVVRR